MDKRYEGWANYQTWYITFLIDHEYFFLSQLKYEYSCKNNPTYNGFREYAELAGIAGEDIFWDDNRLDYYALDEYIREG